MVWKNLARRPFWGLERARTRGYRRVHQRVLEDVPNVCQAIDSVGERWSLPKSRPQRPVFLLAAGWRSGSTAVQRLIMSEHDTLMWGEPYARSSYVQQMSDSLRPLGVDYPRDDYLLDNRSGDLAEQWVANLFPGVEDLKASHRAFFDRLFATPAEARGYRNWGLKEVRLGIGHACYLKWLYPESKLIFLVRDPLDAYRSYLSAGPAYSRWPDKAVITPTEFGQHWSRLARSFLSRASELGGLMLRHEDLLERRRETVTSIEAHLGTRVNPRVLDKSIGGSSRGAAAPPLSRLDHRAILAETEGTRHALGYQTRSFVGV